MVIWWTGTGRWSLRLNKLLIPILDNIKCIAQDPCYTDLDKKIPALHDNKVVNDRAGFAAVDNGSLVYMICGPMWMATIISQECPPAALISNNIVGISSPEWKDEDRIWLVGVKRRHSQATRPLSIRWVFTGERGCLDLHDRLNCRRSKRSEGSGNDVCISLNRSKTLSNNWDRSWLRELGRDCKFSEQQGSLRYFQRIRGRELSTSRDLTLTLVISKVHEM